MSSKILKSCKKAVLQLLKNADFSLLPFTFDELRDCGIESVNILYHKDFPYSYEHPVSKTTLKFNNNVTVCIYQHMENVDCYKIEIEVSLNEKLCKINMSEVQSDKIQSYIKAIKQAYAYRDFWGEVEL